LLNSGQFTRYQDECFFMSAETESSLVTRPSLLERLKDWSQQTAWREFDHDYAPLLRNVARKAGLTDAEADEVAQETLIAVAKKIGEFQHAGNRGSFRAWLYQQARWRIADQFRARLRTHPVHEPERRSPIRREHRDESERAGSETGAPIPCDGEATTVDSLFQEASRAAVPEVDPAFERLWDAEWEEQIRQSALARVKRQVSARQFQLFDLHVLQGLPGREAAKAAGTTIAAVYMAKGRVSRLVRREAERLRKFLILTCEISIK
jgi:RNA polymerase sigma-70 factor (ECF subfamily)